MDEKIFHIEYCIQQLWYYMYELEDALNEIKNNTEDENND